jgi:WD40 repeat protein
MAFSPDGKALAVGLSGGKVRLIEVATGKEGAPLMAEANKKILETRVVFAPDSKTLATRVLPSDSMDKMARVVKLWDLATGKVRRTIEREKGMIRELAFSPDSKTLAVASDNLGITAITLYDPATGKRRSALKLTDDDATSDLHGLAFSPDGKILAASGSELTDRTEDFRPVTRFFSLDAGRESALLAGTRSVTFTPRGGKVVLVVGVGRDFERETAADEVTVRDVADLVPAKKE